MMHVTNEPTPKANQDYACTCGLHNISGNAVEAHDADCAYRLYKRPDTN
jgi:hypothetical protein